MLRPTAPVAAALGDRAPRGGCPGEGPGSVSHAAETVNRVPAPRRAPHQQHARPPDAGDEPVLRPRPASARLARGLPAALPRLGIAVELHAVAPGYDPGERRLALSCRTPQPAPLPRVLAAKPAGLRLPRWISMAMPPKSVTASTFLTSYKPLREAARGEP